MEVILDEMTPIEFFNHGGVVKIKVIDDRITNILNSKKKYVFFEYSKYVKFLNTIILGICDKYPDVKGGDRFILIRDGLQIDANIGNRYYTLDSKYDNQTSLLHCLFYYCGDKNISSSVRDPYGIKNVCFSIVDESNENWNEFCSQREKRGFDDSELWNLDGSFAKFIAPRLTAYYEIVTGEMKCHPSHMSFEEWVDVLNRMIIGFNIMSLDEEKTDDDKNKVTDAVNLFCEHIHDLWI